MTTPYKKMLNPSGDIVSLIHHAALHVIILSPIPKTNGEGYEVDIRQCADLAEAKDKFLGGNNIQDATVDEYNDTLFIKWGFSGSNIYQATTEGEKLVEHLQSENIPVGDGGQIEGSAAPELSTDTAIEVEGQGGTTGVTDDSTTEAGGSDSQGIENAGDSAINNGDEPKLHVGGNNTDTQSDAALTAGGDAAGDEKQE